MKLCWFIANDTGGGVASVARSCALQAARAGHDATLLLLAPSTGWINDSDVSLASLEATAGSPDAPQRLLHWLSKHPQNVLFLNTCPEADAAIPYLPSELRCAYVVHDTTPSHWRTAVAQEDNLDAIIAVSETVAVEFRDKLRQPSKLRVVLNGTFFPDMPLVGSTRKNDIVFLAGGNPIKGAYNVLSLWRTLVGKNYAGKLHWFGKVQQEFRSHINQLPSSDQIIVYGRVPRDVIFSTAATSKVVLVPSHAESFGMATIEAMSMGCIPVAWDIETGTKEIVTAGVTGFFSPLGDIEDFAAQVLYACANHASLIEAVINRARSDFNEKVMWGDYQALIQYVLSTPPIDKRGAKHGAPIYKRKIQWFQLLPRGTRVYIKQLVGRHPKLGYRLRNWRGW